jgi:phosphonoacetaldehyde hydrolase
VTIRAVIFDWAGTVVDYGCRAPVVVLERLFARRGVTLAAEEARHAMGLLKRDQIREILSLPRVSAAFGPWTEEDVERLFQEFIPMQVECAAEYSAVIPGVAETVERLRQRGLRIGSTTGYTRAMLAPIVERAAREGYSPEFTITPDEAGAGRPAPWMLFANMRHFDVYPPRAVVKVGDTPSDIEEARNAGVWSVAVVESSNETAAYGEPEARRRLAGADYLVATLDELPAVIERIMI